jgi:hypothetical protein
VRSRRGRARVAVAQVIGDWTPAPTVRVCRRARRRVMHGKGSRCATVPEMRLHGRRSIKGTALGEGAGKVRVEVAVGSGRRAW